MKTAEVPVALEPLPRTDATKTLFWTQAKRAAGLTFLDASDGRLYIGRFASYDPQSDTVHAVPGALEQGVLEFAETQLEEQDRQALLPLGLIANAYTLSGNTATVKLLCQERTTIQAYSSTALWDAECSEPLGLEPQAIRALWTLIEAQGGIPGSVTEKLGTKSYSVNIDQIQTLINRKLDAQQPS